MKYVFNNHIFVEQTLDKHFHSTTNIFIHSIQLYMKYKNYDNAFSKRLRCLNYPTEFVNEPKKENQKKIDVNINKNFDCWRLDFMLLLIEYYKNYVKTHELKATEHILKWTNQYQENTDLYLQFLNDNTEGNKDGNVHCIQLYDTFKYWFKNNNPNTKIPSNKEFVNNLRKHKIVKNVKVNGKPNLGIMELKLME